MDSAKVRDYLLSPFHRIGRTKAAFFRSKGYTTTDWQRLVFDLRALAISGEMSHGERSAFGQKYLVRGTLRTPSGKLASVVTVWIIRFGERHPRLVTAFPDEQS